MRIHILLFLCAFHLTTYAQESPIYPLHAGDRWEYQYTRNFDSETALIRRIVIGKSLPANGNVYSLLSYPFFGSVLERSEDSKVYFYDDSTDADRLLFDFTDTTERQIAIYPSPWYPSLDSTAIYLEGYSDTAIIFGSPRRKWRFMIDWVRYGADDEAFAEVVEGLGVVRLGGFGWMYELQGAIIDGITYGTFTEVSDGGAYPRTISMAQNYPNPFNPTTTIEVSLPNTCDLTINIVNLLGEEVATLTAAEYPPGVHQFSWRPVDVPTGLYYCTMKAGGQFKTIKLILAK